MAGESFKVLFCSFSVLPEPSGASVRAVEHLKALEGAYEVDGLTVKTSDLSHIERFFGARLMRVPVGTSNLPERSQAFERAVRRQLESDEYRLVQFTDPFGGYALCELKAKHSYKAVFEVCGLPSVEVRYTHPELEADRRFMAKLRRQELFCLMNADAVLTGSEVTAQAIQKLGVPRERIAVLSTGVEAARYLSLPPPDRVSPMRVLYLGNQHAWQGLPTLVAAASLAAASCDLKVSIVGPQSAPMRLQLEEMIRAARLSERVELRDPVGPDELPALLAEADVGVAPLERCDRNELQGAPLAKIAAYMAAGRPVVASDLPMVREVTREDCALFHRAGDERGLAERLVELAKAPQRRVEMGRRAAIFARERLSAERGRARLLGLYRNLLGRSGSAGGVTTESGAHALSDAVTSLKALSAPAADSGAGAQDEPTQTLRNPAPEPASQGSSHTTDPLLPATALPPKASAASPVPQRTPTEPSPLAPLRSERASRPASGSGSSPAEEWLGHVLFGYAPFDPNRPR